MVSKSNLSLILHFLLIVCLLNDVDAQTTAPGGEEEGGGEGEGNGEKEGKVSRFNKQHLLGITTVCIFVDTQLFACTSHFCDLNIW